MALDYSFEEVRVLGVLIEKELSTPDYYPLTLNSLTTGCNQKSNRDPVVSFSQSDVMTVLDLLIRRRMAGHATGASSRSEKFRHATAAQWGLSVQELAVLGSLMLRGPQTVGELRARTSRMHTFESLEEVESVLAGLEGREEPLVTELPRQPGKKEARHAHLLQGEPVVPEDDAEGASQVITGSAASLRQEVDALRERVESLETAFEDFRKQFE